MYRQLEDIEEIERLNKERLKLLVENRELKKKMGGKKNKIQYLKKEVERLTKALAHASPLINLPIEDESSIPFDDGERIIVRDGKQIKQVKHIRGVNDNGEEIGFLTEWELTKQELEEIEKEKRKIADAEEKKQFLEKQNRISEEEPSIPYNKNDERIITRDGKKFKQWFWIGSGCDIWYDEIEIVDEC